MILTDMSIDVPACGKYALVKSSSLAQQVQPSITCKSKEETTKKKNRHGLFELLSIKKKKKAELISSKKKKRKKKTGSQF